MAPNQRESLVVDEVRNLVEGQFLAMAVGTVRQRRCMGILVACDAIAAQTDEALLTLGQDCDVSELMTFLADELEVPTLESKIQTAMIELIAPGMAGQQEAALADDVELGAMMFDVAEIATPPRLGRQVAVITSERRDLLSDVLVTVHAGIAEALLAGTVANYATRTSRQTRIASMHRR